MQKANDAVLALKIMKNIVKSASQMSHFGPNTIYQTEVLSMSNMSSL